MTKKRNYSEKERKKKRKKERKQARHSNEKERK